jgi:hypothetical protein
MNIEYIHQTTSVAYNSVLREEILEAYGTWVKDHVRQG